MKKLRYLIFNYFVLISKKISFFKLIFEKIRNILNIYKRKLNYNLDSQFNRIYHYHVPKSGGTTLNMTIYKSYGYIFDKNNLHNNFSEQASNLVSRSIKINNKVFLDHNKFLINRGHFYYAWSHYPYHEIFPHSDSFTVTTIRNPVNRVISLYKHSLNLTNDSTDKHQKELFLLKSDNILDFVKKLPVYHRYGSLYFYSKKLDINEAFENLKTISEIVLDFDFDSVKSTFFERFNINLEFERENISEISYEPTKDEIIVLENLLEKEIELYLKIKKFVYEKQ